MLVKVIKKDGHYIIPFFEKINLEKKQITVYVDDELIKKQEKDRKNKKSETFKALEEAVEKSGGNSFLKMKLENMPKDFDYESRKTDNEILYDALKEKYEV